MAEIKNPPLLEALRRRFQADWIPQLSDTLNPIVNIEGDPTWPFLAGEQLGVGVDFSSQLGGVNELHVQLHNPTANVIAVVDGISITVTYSNVTTFGAIGRTRIRRADTAISGLALVSTMRDTRWDASAGVNRRTQLQFRNQSSAGVLGVLTLGDAQLLSTSGAFGAATTIQGYLTGDVVCPLVLGPNSGVLVTVSAATGGGDDTVSLGVTYRWRERVMSSWEVAAIRP